MTGEQLSFTIDTLATARSVFFNSITKAGGPCPCCGRFGKIYARTITASMASALAKIYTRGGGSKYEYVHLNSFLTPRESADAAKLRFWGFIECSMSRGGFWRATQDGQYFLRGHGETSRYVFLWGQEVKGFSEGRITIQDVKRFDYAEMMARTFPGDDFVIKEKQA